MRRVLLVLVTLLIAPYGLPGQEPGREEIAGSDRIDLLMAERLKTNAPGAAVMVISDGRIVHQKGYGLADLQARTPITSMTTFDLASVSKQFTAMAIMMLVESGSLSYSDPLSKFFPELPPWASEITVRHLLTHTSGIPSYMQIFEEEPAGISEEPSSREVITMLGREHAPRFAAGARYEYSNSGYVVLAQIVEKVTGKSFPEFMKERVFDRIGMTSTLVSDQIESPSPNRAVSYDGYWLLGWRYPRADYTPLNRIYGDGNVNSSLADMYRWDQALYTDTLVAQRTLSEAFEPMRLDDGTTSDYGFGWRLLEWHGRRVLQHGGSWAGFRSNIVRVPSERLTVVILSNLRIFDVNDAAKTITGYFLESSAEATRGGGSGP